MDRQTFETGFIRMTLKSRPKHCYYAMCTGTLQSTGLININNASTLINTCTGITVIKIPFQRNTV